MVSKDPRYTIMWLSCASLFQDLLTFLYVVSWPRSSHKVLRSRYKIQDLAYKMFSVILKIYQKRILWQT
jgi:hypothetical protein